MNNKYIAIIVGALVILGGAYLIFGKSSAPRETASNGTDTSGTISLQELLYSGGNKYCTVAIEDQNFSASGEAFLAGDQIRVDFISFVADQAVMSSMIQTGGVIYTWTNMFDQGFRFPVEQVRAGGPGPDLSVGVTYECEPWGEVDQGRFALPEGIEFVAPE